MRRIAILVVLVALAACHGTNPAAPTPSTTQPGHGGVVSLAIGGNMSPTPGQTSQLTATATFTDGTTADVTKGAAWFGFSENVGSVSPSGLFTAINFGQVAVYARYGGSETAVTINILPSGTFKLSGYVYEPVGVLLNGARVEILDGPSAGQSRSGSYYVFFGVSGDLHVRASKEGYQPDTKMVSMTQHQRLDFTLAPLTPPTSVAGRYTLTLTASSSCTQLPPEARTRHYTATVDQDGVRVHVILSDATFVQYPGFPENQFSGQIHENAITFTISSDSDNGTYDVLEQLTPSTTLAVEGTATGVTTPAGMALQLTGALTVNPGSSCTATDHQLVFTPSTTTTSRRNRR